MKKGRSLVPNCLLYILRKVTLLLKADAVKAKIDRIRCVHNVIIQYLGQCPHGRNLMVLFHLQTRTVNVASILKKQIPEHLNQTLNRKTVKVKDKVREQI